MESNGSFRRRLLLVVDAKGYGSGNDRQQHAWQKGLLAALDRAAERARLDRSAWERSATGDGEFAVLPPTESEPAVVADFVRELGNALAEHNRGLTDAARLRLRLAIHYGVAIPAHNGFSGQGVVVVNRLVDSAPIREALAATDRANLAVILSRRVFQDTVLQGHTSLRVSDLRKVVVRNKEFTEHAWLYLPGENVHAVSLPDDVPVGPEPTQSVAVAKTSRHDQQVVNDVHGPVLGKNITFGFVNEQR